MQLQAGRIQQKPLFAPDEVRLDIHAEVLAALAKLPTDEPESVVRRLVDAAVQRGLTLPFGRPPFLPHLESSSGVCFAARVLPPIAPVLRKYSITSSGMLSFFMSLIITYA